MDLENTKVSQDDDGVAGDETESRERDRDRRGRAQKGSRFSDADQGDNRERSRERKNCRIYVSNIPYDYRWQDLKDLFRRIVGSVEYVELFNDENGKARGCGIVEFKDPDNVQKALEKMNRHDINGREIVVKEDHGENRDKYGRIIKDNANAGNARGGGGGGGRMDQYQRSGGDRDDMRLSASSRVLGGINKGNVGGGGMFSSNYDVPYSTYGLSSSFLESLGIFGPLHTKIFVANLDYKVDSKKLKQVFKLAGKVQSVDLSLDKEGNSRGFAVIEYDHPVEAVQAISMFDCQMLYDRRMTVRLDRIPDKTENLKLPEGLGGIGIGLGPNGEPLRDVAKNLPSTQQPQGNTIQKPNNQISTGLNTSSGTNSVQPVPVPPTNNQLSNNMMSQQNQASVNLLQGLSESNLVALSNVLGAKNLAALSNPLISSSLSNLGLNMSDNSKSILNTNVDDLPVPPAPSMSLNNYSTGGNNYSTGYSSTSFNSANLGGNNNNINRGDFDSARKNFNTNIQNSSEFNSASSCMFGEANNNNALKSSTNTSANGSRKSDTIIIRNIPLSCTWQTLRDKFRDIGEVKFAEIRGNEVGVVRFFKENDAEIAIKLMDGSRMEGRTVQVNYF